MRLPDEKIKAALVHPERLVRQEALQYFAGCYSRDTEVMPLAIQAIETYGRQAFPRLYDLPHLAQTEATVEWAFRELHRESDPAEPHDRYFLTLSEILCSADPPLVAPQADRILQAPRFSEDLAPAFQERLQLASWDADRCWAELERIAAEGVAQQDDELDVDLEHAGRLVEALARQGDPYAERILELLGRKIENYDTDPMVWMEIFLVMLAGEMRLEQAIPLVVQKLHETDDDILPPECAEALGKIGTDAAAEAVTARWLEATWEYRLFATDALEKIHADTTVRKCLELLPHDKDVDIRTKLADALLSQFADEGVEPVRAMVQQRAYDEMCSNLMAKLVTVSTLLGVTFPEYSLWKRQSEERLAKQERRIKKLEESWYAPEEPLPPPKAAPAREQDYFLERKQAPFVRTEKQVGRNDPCPCGSGKKFKNCCMRKGKS